MGALCSLQQAGLIEIPTMTKTTAFSLPPNKYKVKQQYLKIPLKVTMKLIHTVAHLPIAFKEK